MNRHERRAAKACKAKSVARIVDQPMIDTASAMLEDGLGQLKIKVIHLATEDIANAPVAHLIRQFRDLGKTCPLCDQALNTSGFGALAMISPGGDYVMRFDEQGFATKPVVAQAVCDSCSRKPQLELLVAENFFKELGYFKAGAPS